MLLRSNNTMLLIQISAKKYSLFRSCTIQLHRVKIFKAPFKKTNLREIWRENIKYARVITFAQNLPAASA